MPDQIVPVALVTGAGSGIGRAVALKLGQEGFRLVLAGRRMGALEETASFLPPDVEAVCVPCDVSDPASGHILVTTCLGRFGRIDVIVNNAGLAPLLPIERTTAETIQQTYFTNAIGPACAIAAAWLVFKRQAAEQRLAPTGHCIINVSTFGTRDPFPGFFAYAASKASLNVMAQSCAKEGADINVRAFSIAPGAVETAMLRELFSPDILPPEHTLSPDTVADEIVACIVGERDAKNGQTIYMSPK